MNNNKRTFEGVTANVGDYIAKTATHVLIGGIQGAGKSTFETLLINSLMFTTPTPALILIDPKRVDLAGFRPMRNVIRYTDDTAGARTVLREAVEIIERRYSDMQKTGAKVCPERPVYIIIDELADLVLHDKKLFDPIHHILSKGRQSNVRMIACTQVVCSQILPPLIRYNFDCVCSLRCATPMASRLLLDAKGAEDLPRRGKVIIKDAEGLRVEDFPKIPEDQIDRLVEFWKR